jgi:hypothetical protein
MALRGRTKSCRRRWYSRRTLSPSPLERAHDQSVTQRITVPCKCKGLRWRGSPALKSSLRQSGAVRNTKRPLCKNTSGLKPYSVRPRAILFRKVGSATTTTCWPISNPGTTNCMISLRPFSFRTIKRHVSAWAISPTWSMVPTPIVPIVIEMSWGCQQDNLAQGQSVTSDITSLRPLSLPSLRFPVSSFGASPGVTTSAFAQCPRGQRRNASLR